MIVEIKIEKWNKKIIVAHKKQANTAYMLITLRTGNASQTLTSHVESNPKKESAISPLISTKF